jgi:ribosomal protein S18 acetylase RimI-like enzyme
VLPRRRKPTRIITEAANDAEPEPPAKKTKAKDERPAKAKTKPKGPRPEPKPKPPPSPKIRDAKASDAPRLAELIHYLGHEIDEKSVRRNLKALMKSGETPLVASLDKKVVGMCGIGRRVVIHRPAPLGRITALVVAKEAQDLGIGRMLVEAAERWMREKGCKLVEVTSNDRRTAAHAFYRHLGYERTSMRFAKKL